MLIRSQNSVQCSVQERVAAIRARESWSPCVAIVCGGSVVFCLTIPVVFQKSAESTNKRLQLGKVLRSALPDEIRSGEDVSLGSRGLRAHALLHARTGERVTAPQVTPIASVPYTRPVTWTGTPGLLVKPNELPNFLPESFRSVASTEQRRHTKRCALRLTLSFYP